MHAPTWGAPRGGVDNQHDHSQLSSPSCHCQGSGGVGVSDAEASEGLAASIVLLKR